MPSNSMSNKALITFLCFLVSDLARCQEEGLYNKPAAGDGIRINGDMRMTPAQYARYKAHSAGLLHEYGTRNASQVQYGPGRTHNANGTGGGHGHGDGDGGGEWPESHGRRRRKVARESWQWASTRIDYTFHSSVPQQYHSAINGVLADFEEKTCLRFQYHDQLEPTAVGIIFHAEDDGCWSFVGQMQELQIVNLSPDCLLYTGVIYHELLHALGLMHEHSRADADQYVAIVSSNIDIEHYDQFVRTKSSYIDNTIHVPYDYGSVMHYSANAFAVDERRPTIVPSEGNEHYASTMGQRRAASYLDWQAVNMAYCWDRCEQDGRCGHNAYRHPNDCDRCLCPPMSWGATCEWCGPNKDTDECGDYMQTEDGDGWSTVALTSDNDLAPGAHCVYKLRAKDKSKRVVLEFTELELYHNVPTGYESVSCCRDDYAQVTMSCDLRPTGPRFCGDEPPATALTSEEDCYNIMLTVHISHYSYMHRIVTFKFRQV